MTFDPQSFLDQSTTDANSTVREPIPEGEYTAIVDKVDVRSFQGTKDPSKTYVSLDVTWAIDDEAVRQKTGLPKPTCRQSLMLDLTEGGGLDMGKGKNVGLGRLREAVGLNAPGRPFSFRQLEGQVAKVFVTHRATDEAVYDEIKKVAAL